jgi:hypothetical protein
MEALIQWLTVFILTKANSMNESVLPHLPGHKKSAHGRNNSAKDGFNPRCHLVSRYRALCEIPSYLRQLTRASRCGILCHPFRRTLSGPFGRLPFHPFSPARTLFGCISCFDLRFNGFLLRRLYPFQLFVKRKESLRKYFVMSAPFYIAAQPPPSPFEPSEPSEPSEPAEPAEPSEPELCPSPL